MQTVTLELLRHGPRHNQLLSPLTEYLALCGNHQAVTIHVPFEHSQFLHRLRALEYRNEKEREFHLKDTAEILGQILANIPGLTSELSKDSVTEKLTHFRLILSSSELALLPFELALAPNGFPGAGQSLTLQPQLPLCLTREVRRAGDDTIKWPLHPKILFIAASPPGVGPVPLESHLLALRRAISPWIGFTRDEADLREKISEHLVVLPRASVDSIYEKCACDTFTHIHVLAHGHEYPTGDDRRFGLALHNRSDPDGEPHIISGQELATLLRSCKKPDARQLASPVVVTIASCNSANIGTVVGAGASIAHELHDADIPMVVASQFPLSFAGSVLMVETLYEGLLWGYDPRPLLNDVRRQLRARVPETHDWASVVAYLALPRDFDERLSEVQVARAHRSVEAALDHADKSIELFSEKHATRGTLTPTESEKEKLLVLADNKITNATARLRELRTPNMPKDSPISGILASAEKRHAELLFNFAKLSRLSDERRNRFREDSLKTLRRSRDDYWSAFEQDRANSWAIVQYLSLSVALGGAGETGSSENQAESPMLKFLNLAEVLSQLDQDSGDHMRGIWALGNLIELNLLKPTIFPGANRRTSKSQALASAKSLLKRASFTSFEVYSTRRQIVRYIEWFNQINPKLNEIASDAEEVYQILSQSPV
jgi:hypothetical protein